MVYFSEPFDVLDQTQINDSSYTYALPPFPRSTFLVEDAAGTQIIYLVDRNLMFMRYDINNFTERQVIRRYSVPLDSSILNDTCSDLQRVTYFEDDLLLMFCTTISFTQDDTNTTLQRVILHTLVQISNLTGGGTPVIRYLTYNETAVKIERNMPLINMGCEFKNPFFSQDSNCLYLGVAAVPRITIKQPAAVILRVNMSEFEDMAAKKQFTRITLTRQPVRCKYWIQMPKELEGLPITYVDLLPISLYTFKFPWFTVLVEGQYVMFCQYFYSYIITQQEENKSYSCYVKPPIVHHNNLGSLFHNARDPKFIYASMVSPPGVVEIRVEDPINAYVNRVYQVGEDNYVRYIGQPQIASNQNFIIHLMSDMITNRQVVRVYDRGSNFFSTAMFDYYLPAEFQTGYFLFPSYFYDILLYRDEYAMTLVQIVENFLILNATDSQKLHKVIQTLSNDLYINITSKNSLGKTILTTGLNVTFVTEEDTQIYSVSKDILDQRILYNCGDKDFQFAINGYFNGPNYELNPLQSSEDSCQNGSCFFSFSRKNMTETFKSYFDFAQCQEIYSLPNLERTGNQEDHLHGDLILICMDIQTQKIRTYLYDENGKNLTQGNTIELQNSRFLGSFIDFDYRMLVLFTNATSGLDESEQWINHTMVVHAFNILNEVIWKGSTTIMSSNGQMMEFNNVGGVSYNTISKRGVLVGKPQLNQTSNSTVQILTMFDVSPDSPFVTELTSANLTVSLDPFSKDGNQTTRILKSDVSEEGFIYVLQENGKMVVYEAFEYIIYNVLQPLLAHKVVKRWEQSFGELQNRSIDGGLDPSKDIHDFEILNGNFIALYTGENQTFIYEIQMQIYWRYRMLLPMYSQYYNGYHYYSSTKQNDSLVYRRIIRGSVGSYLVILMAKVDQDQADPSEFQVFFYNFQTTQHDSLIMVQNVTAFYSGSTFQNVYLIEDGGGEARDITLMTDKQLSLNQIRLKSSLVLNSDIGIQNQLIGNCSQLANKINDYGLLEDLGGTIAQLQIAPTTRFSNQTHSQIRTSEDAIADQLINLRVITQNQGLIPLPSQNNSNIRISYAGDSPSDADPSQQYYPLTQNMLFMQELVDGYNLNYDFNCVYKNLSGQEQSCNDAITDQTQTIKNVFSIEQVTSQNQILKCFSMGRLFVMLDSSQMMHVLALYDDEYMNTQHSDDKGNHYVNQSQLVTIKSFKQMEKLGCNVTDFADYFELFTENNETTYLLMYQCYVNGKTALKFTSFIVKRVNETNVNPEFDQSVIASSITNLTGQIDVAVPILDVEVYDYCVQSSTFKFILTVTMNGTYQNILFFYDAKYNKTTKSVTFQIEDYGYMSAYSTNMDTFKVQQVLMVPGFGTHLALIALQDRGAIMIDTESYSIIKEFNIKSLNPFPEQTSQEVGDLQVFSVAGDWPYSFHILSNYGLYVFMFKTNLTNRPEVMNNPEQSLEAFQKRVLQLYFDQYNYELASNPYGYAFLVTKYNSANSFSVYLGGISFNAMVNSKILKMIPIFQNQQCISLNQQPLLALSDEDQIAVSFICNTQLFVVQLCFKPNILTDFDQFKGDATRWDSYEHLRQPATLQYGQFNLTINATNEYYTSGFNNLGLIKIVMEYEPTKEQMQVEVSLVYFIIIMMLIIAVLSLAYLNFRMQEIRQSSRLEREQNYQRASRYAERNSRHYRSTFKLARGISTSSKIRSLSTPNLQDQQYVSTKPSPTDQQNRQTVKTSDSGMPSSISQNQQYQDPLSYETLGDHMLSSSNGFDPYNNIKEPRQSDYTPSPQRSNNLNSMLSLGISHKPALKSAMRNSMRGSDISSMAYGNKLDLAKFKNPEEGGGIGGFLMRNKAKESGKHKRRLIDDPKEKEPSKAPFPKVALNDTISLRGSGDTNLLHYDENIVTETTAPAPKSKFKKQRIEDDPEFYLQKITDSPEQQASPVTMKKRNNHKTPMFLSDQ